MLNNKQYVSLTNDGDWMVNLSSQLGFGYKTTKYIIPFEKRYLYNDTDGGYDLIFDYTSLHAAILHISLVNNKICDILKAG